MSENYLENAKETKEKLNQISPTMCMAKWLQVSMHLPQGLTQSCYHPPTHKVPLNELKVTPRALHNTHEKVKQRKQMWEGERPSGCQYCWNIEDAPDGPHLSDRHYRSSEWWVKDAWDEVVNGSWDENINPRYVEVNFNQACNFKCTYCSPHLSTEWEKEVNQFGPYDLVDGDHNNIGSLTKSGLMPIGGKQSDNPYIEAFWQWWPELYPELKVFRMTGGEPLMDKNTFKVLNYIKEQQYPNNDLELSITSNMCPPEQVLFDKFVNIISELENKSVWNDESKVDPNLGNWWLSYFKHFSLFVSVDSVGEQAEYIRTGLEFDRMLSNVKTFLNNTKRTEITFINTFNIMSIPNLKNFLRMILELRKEFGFENQKNISIMPPEGADLNKFSPAVMKPKQRIWFDIPYLRYPDWMSAQNAVFYPELIDTLNDCVAFMEENVETDTYYKTYHGFKKYEIAKLKRDIAWIKSGKTISEEEINKRRANFYHYFTETDKRRDTNFAKTFPELTNWWKDCQHYATQRKKHNDR